MASCVPNFSTMKATTRPMKNTATLAIEIVVPVMLLEIPGNPRTIASTMISTMTLATSRMKAGIIGVKGPHVPEAALLVLESVMVYFSETTVLW